MQHHRTFRTRFLLVLAPIAIAAAVAAGCGSSNGSDDPSTADIGASAGPLSWLPTETWLVTQVDIDAKRLDTALGTLDRLPIWSLAQGFVDAKDGAAVRKAAFTQIAKDAPGKVTAKQLESVIGSTAGLAITSNDVKVLGDLDDTSAAPFAAWIDVDDEAAADALFERLAGDSSKEQEHEGVTFHVGKVSGDPLAWTVQDDLLLITPGAKQMHVLIDAHAGDSIGDDATARRTFEAASGPDGALTSALLGTDALTGMLVQAIEEEDIKVDGGALSERAVKRALTERSVDALIPDWYGFSATIDDAGLRMRGTWSNPRDLADASPGSRELAERMPATAPIVSAMANDGSMLGRVQDAWKDVRGDLNLDLGDLPEQCASKERWACDAAADIAAVILEDEDLAEELADADPSTLAYVQDPLASLPGTRATGAASIETVSTNTEALKIADNDALKDALLGAGIILTTDPSGLSVTIKVVPTSPLGRMLRAQLTPATSAQLRAGGLDIASLLSPKGITISSKEVDDLLVATFPQGAKSAVIPALEGDADTLDDDADYQKAIDAAEPPETVGSWGWVNIGGIVEASLAAAAKEQPEVGRFGATVRNNLSDVPGILSWTTRTKLDGEDVGVGEVVIPVLK